MAGKKWNMTNLLWLSKRDSCELVRGEKKNGLTRRGKSELWKTKKDEQDASL